MLYSVFVAVLLCALAISVLGFNGHDLSVEKVTSRYSSQFPGAEYFAVRMRQVPVVRERTTCLESARIMEEPFTAAYHPRNTTSTLGDSVPRSVWRWPGTIDKPRFDAAAAWKFKCTNCIEQIVHYKVIGGRLYVTKSAKPQDYWRTIAEEMLNALLYLFPIPDMEFLIFLGDGCTPMPVIQWNICFHHKNPGFTMPSYNIWSRSMGRTQLAAYHSCLTERYPPQNRKPQAVWRGSNTNNFGKITKDNYNRAMRVQLHLLSRNHPDVLDARITDLIPENTDDFVRDLIHDRAPRLGMEDYNQYCVIIDVDGNGWSDRFGTSLVHYPTPVLKVASNHSAWFEHLYAPGAAIEQFSPDMSDLLPTVRAMIDDCVRGGARSRGQRMARNMQATSRALLDHIGILEGFAHTLLAYKNLTTWPLDPSVTEFVEVDPACCQYAKLPPAFARAVSRRLIDGRVPAAGGDGA